MMDDDYYAILEHEFSAEEGSFLLQLRCEMRWDKDAFTRLTEAMLACCKAYDMGDEQPTLFGSAYEKTYLPRRLVYIFWRITFDVNHWTSHPTWEKRIALDPEYYFRVQQRLDDLATWFFTGNSPYQDIAKGFAPM